ncbi:phytoene desaturase family protein [Polyangium aurulentum]|uniref:phytoene desaturase family protein n=1 Tax=Polyangium aurulentum TaxID=2567896 RepID=UPI0010AE7B8F|nr:NAD(P)/FAD-dependent oxidoreductase [Polyangium aurulentum]UQA61207.1 NAD(P)/FAD-dependent oxidoreductase [Polyangium aurulentum]
MPSSSRAIVIGTGTGGLASAAFLAKEGFDVLALERADVLGGYLAPFSREGFVFDPGLHYVGACRPGQLVHDLLARLGIDAGPLFCELDPDGFDVLRFPDLEVRICRPLGAYRERLLSLFPGNAKGLRHFFNVLGGAAKLHNALSHTFVGRPILSDLIALSGVPALVQWGQRPLRELIEQCSEDDRLRAVLAGQSGGYGLPPSRVVALAALLFMVHFSDGAFFPRGGGGALRDALVRAAEGHGARFRARAAVERIIVERGRVKGVLLADGERIEADLVVSSVAPTTTLHRLVGGEHLSKRLLRKASVIEPSMAVFSVFLGLRRDLRAYGLGAQNLWLYPTYDIEESFAARFTGKLPPRPFLFVSPTSLKDDSGTHAPPGCSTLEVIAYVPYAQFRKWQRLSPGERGPAYEARREQLGDWVLSELERRCPGLVSDVVVREYATPLAAVDRVQAVDGAPFGPAMTRSQWGPSGFRTRTPVGGLLLAGSGVFGHGVGPCLLSGLSASKMAGMAP